MAGHCLPDPEEEAAALLERAELDCPPVVLEKVAALWEGVEIAEEWLDGEGYLIDLGSIGAQILVRANARPTRKRYTIAHELGHWALIARRNGTSAATIRVPHHVAEKWCDTFAAALLMPRAWLSMYLRFQDPLTLLDLILSGPKVFGVSEQAFYLRVAEVARICLVECREANGRVRLARRYAGSDTPDSIAQLPDADLVAAVSQMSAHVRIETCSDDIIVACRQKAASVSPLRWIVCAAPRIAFANSLHTVASPQSAQARSLGHQPTPPRERTLGPEDYVKRVQDRLRRAEQSREP